METLVNFIPNQALPSSELMALQGFVQTSDDRIVRELLFDEGRFVGLTVTKIDALNVAIAAGGYYRNGAVYRKGASSTASLSGLIPSSGSRIVLVVVSGDTVLSAPQNVKVLKDAGSNTYVTVPSSTRKAREASVELIGGPQGSSPSRPALPAGAIVVASMTITSAGIVDGPDMEVANTVISLEKAMTAIALLQAQDKKTAALINTLRSDIAALARRLRDKADASFVDGLTDEVLIIKERLDIPDTASLAGVDNFASASETDPASTAVVEAGYVKCGEVERNPKLITLANPSDSRLDISASALILPKSTDVIRIDSDDRDEDIAIASYGVTTQTLKRQALTRSYYWYQEKAPYAELEAKLKQMASVRVRDPKTDAFVDLDLRGVDWKLVGRAYDRLPASSPFYRIDVSTDTWSIGSSTIGVTGAKIAQTLLVAQAGWHKRVDIWFSDVGATGDVTLAVCRVNAAGTPDRDRVVALVTKPVSQIKKGWNSFAYDPFFLMRGERYALMMVTTGNHKVGVSKSNDYSNGTFFVSTDGEYWQGYLEKDLCFRLYGCKFSSAQVTIELDNITLPGGIRSLQAMLTGYQPSGTDLVLQGRIGGVWRTIGEADDTVLSTQPTQIELRFVFVGTKDLMPAIDLSASRVVAARPLASSAHISTARTLPSGVTTASVKVAFDSVGYDSAIHTLTVSLLTGAGFATETAFTSVKRSETRANRHRHAFTIGGLPNIAAYKIKAVMTTSNTARCFALDSRKDVA